jgi:DNA (cytosine-5)-methyltransferase 1
MVVAFVGDCFKHWCPDNYVRPRTRTRLLQEKLRRNTGIDRLQTELLKAPTSCEMNHAKHSKSTRRPSRRKGAIMREKLQRIRRGGQPRLLDVFSGCGGMTLGFTWANCCSVGGIEKDPVAALSYARNFHKDEEKVHGRSRDVTKIDADGLAKELAWEGEDASSAVDIILAGPPCPSFSRAGRAKLASLNGGKVDNESAGPDKEAFLNDHRTHLYQEVIKLAEQLHPVAIVMENVPEFLQHGGTNHGDKVCENLEALGYNCRYSILNAAHYGVPQWRDRFIMIAIHQSACVLPTMPQPTHSLEGQPIGYKGRLTHLGLEAKAGDSANGSFFIPTPGGGRMKPVSSIDALGDLPEINFVIQKDRFTVKMNATWGKGEPFRYRVGRPRQYQLLMRSWGKMDKRDHMHVTRLLSMKTARDQRIFREMRQGAEYREALECASQKFEKELRLLERKGIRPIEGANEYVALEKKFKPPYPDDKFNNKWWKLREAHPSRTLTAHIGKDTYSHIHFDGTQARTITVREAARLQSIPDAFKLEGKMNARFRQIGNSVPPLMARALARQLLQTLGDAPQ